MNTNQLTLEQALPIWWAFAWRAALSASVAGLFVGFIGGFIVGAAGAPEIGGAVGALLAWMASIPCSIWALREALGGSYPGIEVVISEKVKPATELTSVSARTGDLTAALQLTSQRTTQYTGKELTDKASTRHAWFALVGLLGICLLFLLWLSASGSSSTRPGSTGQSSTSTGGEPSQAAASNVMAKATGANMLICDPLPSPSSVTPAQVDAAFSASAPAIDDAGMAKVEAACFTRQSYLLAATDGDPKALAESAILACHSVSDEYRSIVAKNDPGRDLDTAFLGDNTPSLSERLEQKIVNARVGKCWLQ